MASPLTAAITGWSRSKRSVSPPKPVAGISSTPLRARSLRSEPTQNARSPAPVSTSTRASRSAA